MEVLYVFGSLSGVFVFFVSLSVKQSGLKGCCVFEVSLSVSLSGIFICFCQSE